MKLTQGAILFSLCLLLVFGACRRNTPSLVDRNEAPETELWFAPADSTEYEYQVHLYWRGRDNDGTVQRYIWTIQDTIVADVTTWNPAQRLADLRSGRFISSTDTIIPFTAFRNVDGVGVRKNRQAFFIAAIDDNGIIDPSPAAIEFVATIEKLPRIHFATYIGGVSLPYVHRTVPRDTVGMFAPFELSYHGTTTNGRVRAYKWAPLSQTIILPGADIWTDNLTGRPPGYTPEDGLADTLRAFTNTGDELLPAGVFKFSATCRDDAKAESAVDAATFVRGVAQIKVNFDPDTRFNGVENTYVLNDVAFPRSINFQDGIPDTVSYQSWVRLDYSGWDDSRDIVTCSPPAVNPDRCIDFQIRYNRQSARVQGSIASSGWLPLSAPFQNSDTLSATDSNTVNLGSLEYDFFARAIDENGSSDGTPPVVPLIGNFDPTLDSMGIESRQGPLNLSTIDTLTWDFGMADSAYLDIATVDSVYVFSWRIKAQGHDHPWDPDGSGVKAWRYFIYTDYGTPAALIWPLARSGETFVNGIALDRLNDKFQLTVRFKFTDLIADREGTYANFFANLPAYFDTDLTIVLIGRDTGVNEPDFRQNVFLNGGQQLINVFPAASFGRWTKQEIATFHFRLVR